MAIKGSINSNRTDVESTKEALITSIRRTAEKTVQEAGYDKTILATVQYCTDAALGQYKIKYQDGYFTAYSLDTTVKYSNKASVFIKVQNNDMTKRMYIIGLATDDSDGKQSLTHLEGDQQFGVVGLDFIKSVDAEKLKMLSYHGGQTFFGETLYYVNSTNNIIQIQKDEVIKQELINAMSMTDNGENKTGYFRLGAEFKTAFDDRQKTSAGNYGLKVRFAFQKSDEANEYFKDYIIDTFNMEGTPFNFPSFTPQYNYWEVNPSEFKYVESITMFTQGFDNLPDGETLPYAYDIFLRNISMKAAMKYYNSDEDDSYKVKINAESTTFEEGQEFLPVSADLTKLGNPISSEEQNLKYIWGREDPLVDSVNNKRYNSFLGKGWYCLNPGYKKNYSNETFEEVGDPTKYTILSTKKIGKTTVVEWDYNVKNINIPRFLCQSKTTNIKCVIVYENVAYTSPVLPLTNPLGYFLVVKDDSQINFNFKSGYGYDTITAGLFKYDRSGVDAQIVDVTLDNDITYKWILTTPDSQGDGGMELPSEDPKNILMFNQDWEDACEGSGSSKYNPNDYIETTDNQVRDYYDEIEEHHGTAYKEAMRLSLNRYEYYDQNFGNDITDNEKARIKSRKRLIVREKADSIYSNYVENYDNTAGYYILGPTSVKNISESSFTIDERIWYGTPAYSGKPYNTLYKVKGESIISFLRIQITAIKPIENPDTHEMVDMIVGSETVTLSNGTGTGLDYDLKIVNGEQTFIYSTGGLAPTSAKNDQNPMSLQPLYFQLYDKNGNLLFDSQREGDDLQLNASGFNIQTLNPVWTTYDNQYSLIQTTYKSNNNDTESFDANDPKIIHIKNVGKLVYGLAEKFDFNLRDYSNVDLKVTVNGTVYYATTHFNFAKQGDIGTNGTENYLDIDDLNYEEYRDGILSSDSRSYFKFDINGVVDKRHFGPDARHLKNTYLYATQGYDSNHAAVKKNENIKYVNLKFAKGSTEDPELIVGVESIVLGGYWSDESEYKDFVAADTKWFLPLQQGTVYGKDNDEVKQEKMDCTSSFSLRNSTGATAYLDINYCHDNPLQALIPTKKISTLENGMKKTTVANNIVGITSKREVSSIIDPGTKKPVVKSNTTYYPMPFFFYSVCDNTTNYADGKDPTEFISVIGGFDTVTYDGGGLHPQYNQQMPFTLCFYDINHKDITSKVIKKGSVSWDCSYGLVIDKNWDTTGEVKARNYADIPETEQLYGKYCYIQGATEKKYYKCIHKHVKEGVKTIKATGETYGPGEFVVPYWKEVNPIAEGMQKCYVTPAKNYDTLASQSLYNAWISVTVDYTDNTVQDNKVFYSGQVMIPINMICNKYGSDEINGWNGKSLDMGEDYMLAAKVAAGVKEEDNGFTGIHIGTNFYPDEGANAVGLFGRKDGVRTIFMDARTGRTFLGPNNSAQIILNPGNFEDPHDDHPWSRLSSWYINNQYLYKPIGEGAVYPTNKQIDGLDESFTLDPPDTQLGSIGMYCPYTEGVTSQDVFLWASAKERDPDIDDVIQEMLDLQSSMAVYGVLFASDYSMINDRTRVKYYKQQITSATHDISWETLYGTTVPLSQIKKENNPNWDTWVEQTDIEEKDLEMLRAEILKSMAHYQTTDSTEQQVVTKTISELNINKATAETDLPLLIALIDQYDQYYGLYGALLKTMNSGTCITYNGDKKKANFYVTYGGHMHCESADVSGKIVAQTGQFGTGLNKILISTVKDGKRYILYNKNFWVGDNDGDGETEIYMKGEIRAKAGQIGRVADDIDGYDTRTVFLQYPWYSWRMPGPNEPFNESFYHLDTRSGKNTTYPIYHKNFSITNNGEVRLNGKIFSREGRIGDWVIDNHNLRDYLGNIVLHPSDDPNAPASGTITLGLLTLRGDGSIDGTNWNIDSNGKAYFTNANNEFTAARYQIGESGGPVLDDRGLKLEIGESMEFGDTHKLQCTSEGFRFTGNTIFGAMAKFQGNGIEIPTGTIKIGENNGTLNITNQGITMNSVGPQAGTFTINSGGITFPGVNAPSIGPTGCNNLQLNSDSCKIDSQSIATYVQEKINDAIRDLPNKISVSVTISPNQVAGETLIATAVVTANI